MSSRLRDSLVARLAMLMAGVLSLTLITMGASIYVAETTQGMATAINQAGTLRMQSYLVTARALLARTAGTVTMGTEARAAIGELERRLTLLVETLRDTGLHPPLEIVARSWHEELTPRLKTGTAPDRLLNKVDTFVEHIDEFLLELQHAQLSPSAKVRLVNEAGALRMQVYRIMALILPARRSDPSASSASTQAAVDAMNVFEHRLASPRLTAVLQKTGWRQARAKHEHISREWRDELKPRLQAYLGGALASPVLLADVDQFVHHVDAFVQTLEDNAESHIRLLRWGQGTALLLIVGSMLLGARVVHRGLIRPLQDLSGCAERVRHGDFSCRASHTDSGELGRLGHTFNIMAADLSAKYRDLETRIDEKTSELRRTNASLELLYNTIRRLHEDRWSDRAFALLLGDIQKILPITAGAICARDQTGRPVQRARTPRDASGEVCGPLRCDDCPNTAPSPQAEHECIRVAVRDQERRFGSLVLETPVSPEAWQLRLLEALGRHIGMALAIEESLHDRRLTLGQERTAIARELHDSLAQALSYMKIQVTRLQSRVDRGVQDPQLQGVLDELRAALNGAYEDLRELLASFRLRMDKRGLRSALSDSVVEFEERGVIGIELDFDLPQGVLNPNEEIHVLQIVREALSNVLRHALATRARVTVRRDPTSGVTVRVKDDGIGLPVEHAERRYGLQIMQERAEALGGSFAVYRRHTAGTCVELCFLPEQMRRQQTGTPEPVI